MREITITSLEEGQRLDRVLQKYLSRATAGFLYKMLRKKNITLNGKKAEGKEKLQAGDIIRLYFAEETLDKFTTSQDDTDWPRTQLDIVYEDKQILLINKDAGMLSQKAESSDVSLNEYAIGYLLESGAVSRESLASFRPSVCNRLDRNTSGIVAVGKTTAALQELSLMFRERTIHKYYQALVIGRVEEEGTIDALLVKDEKKNQVRIYPAGGSPSPDVLGEASHTVAEGEGIFAQRSFATEKTRNEIEKGQRIRTRYVPVAYRTDGQTQHELTLLEIELITGRSHQIRAHLASIGHPVVGDPKYGNRRRNEYFAREYGLHRQLLHAGRIAFSKEDGALGYLSGREFTAKLPDVFESIMKREGVRS